jgi:glycosyltransferase involved in cell wall biosynthesis
MSDTLSATILQVIPELETGGAERTTIEMAEAIISAGGTAIVVSNGGPMVAELDALGAKHVEMPVHSKNPFVMWRNVDRLKKLIKLNNIDLVHARSRAPAWSALKAARACHLPFITTYHGAYRAKSTMKRRYNSIMARGDYVIANSEFTRNAIMEEFCPDPLKYPDRLLTIHRGADMRRFDPKEVDPARIEALEQAWHGGDAVKILLPGRLTDWKGQRTLIEAAQILRVTRQALNLRIVLAGSAQGRSGYEAELQRLIKEAGVEHMVTIPGNCSDMPAAYCWADMVVSASLRPEAFGRIAIEAQAMGRPVIATNHGGARETVRDGVTGFLVRPGDAKALANAISHYVDLPTEEREAMGRMARQHAMTDFSTEKMTKSTLSVYKKALKEFAVRG